MGCSSSFFVGKGTGEFRIDECRITDRASPVVECDSLDWIAMSEGETEDTQEDHEGRETHHEKDTGVDMSGADSMQTGKKGQDELRCHLSFKTEEEDFHQNDTDEASDDRPKDR
jgi:hypothetical protein